MELRAVYMSTTMPNTKRAFQVLEPTRLKVLLHAHCFELHGTRLVHIETIEEGSKVWGENTGWEAGFLQEPPR